MPRRGQKLLFQAYWAAQPKKQWTVYKALVALNISEAWNCRGAGADVAEREDMGQLMLEQRESVELEKI